MKNNMLISSNLTFFLACFLGIVSSPSATTTALVITGAPPIGSSTSTTPNYQPVERQATTTTTTTRSIRIRSTQESDLNHVSSLLASASLGLDHHCSTRITNFKIKMELLRQSASLQKTLHTRYKALKEGRKLSTLQQFQQECQHQAAMLLWSRNTFRQKIEKAANMASNDPHMWKGHNFALSPPDPTMLQHAMITAQDVETGDIIGFCEVAMLCQPHNKDAGVAPTISNLVISPDYRRQGIASSLLDSAARYVRHSWSSSNQLGLYVDQHNSGAVKLYAQHGFEKESETDTSTGNRQWYMSRPLFC